MKTAILFLALITSAAAQSIGLSVNGDTSAQIEPRMPLIVTATVVGDAGTPALSATGPDATSVALPLVSRPTPPEVGAAERTLVWTVAPEALGQLAPGTYTLKAERGREVTFTIASTSTAETAESRAARLLLLSTWAELEGDGDKAVGLAEELLAAQPDSIAARLRLSDLREARGQLAEALVLLDEAEKIFRRGQARPGHPPITIRARQSRILDAMSK